MKACALFFAWLAVLGLVAGLTAGCSKAKKSAVKPKETIAEPIRHAAGGQAQASGCDDELADVFFISRATLPAGAPAPTTNDEGRIGFIVGQANTLLKTTDGGATWRRILPRQPQGPHFERVLFLSTNAGWVVSRGVLLHTGDGGKTWTPAQELPKNFYYFGPAAATASAYYQMQPPTCSASIWETRDGVAWQTLPTGLPRNDYEAVFFFNGTCGWVAGNYGQCARTVDGGRTWQEQTLEGEAHFSQIQFISPQTGWMRPVMGHKGNIWATRDGGQSWQKQNTGIKTYWNPLDMQFLDAQTGFLLVHVQSKQSQVLRTTDGGASWNLIGTHAADMMALSFISAQEGWVVGAGGCVFHYQL
ncbi:MAG: hypothetical protein KKD76_05000 [Verrucomicrobia bacterium]|nr:hypothetical protein [Verrucomicrobiota bacterium]